MKYGFILPYGDARTVADLAFEAETAGWDGFFVWEAIWGNDAWVALTAAAMRTERIRLGTMLTPLSRMRPWKLASETATLDNLSNGRVVLAVGLGHIPNGFEAFGEVTDRKTRAELLDEGLDVLTGLWRGQPFSYNGKHYQVREFDHFPPPPPVQQPRIPIWVVGAWPRRKSFARVCRYDGLLPVKMNDEEQFVEVTPVDIQAMTAYVDEHRIQTTPFDIMMEGQTPGVDPEQAASIVHPWAQAGVTWWLEAMWDALYEPDKRSAIRQRIQQGPPRLKQGQ